MEREWFEWIWEKITRCLNPSWQVAESNMAEFRVAAIIKLIRMNDSSFFVQRVGTNLGKCEWVWEDKLRWLNEIQDGVWISRLANSRWLPSSSWVRMNEWSIFCANGGNQSCQVWVSLRGKTKMVESKMVEFKLAEFKMAAIIKLSQKKWVKFFFAKWLNPIWQNSIWLPSSSWVRMNEWSFLCKCWELILASVNEFDRKN